MGGKNEQTIPQTPSNAAPKQAQVSQAMGDVRVHESNGEIHIHDDVKGLKVAVPVADFWQQWRRLESTGADATFIDHKNQTHATLVKIFLGTQIDIETTIEPLDIGPAYQAYNNLVAKA